MKNNIRLMLASLALITAPATALADADTDTNLERPGAIEVMGTVQFGFDSAALDSGDRAKIDQIASWLAENPGYRVVIEGHTDAYGSSVYNIGLASDRARVVREAILEESGVARDRVVAVVYGKDYQPLPSPYAAGNRMAAIYSTTLTPRQLARDALDHATAVIWE